MYYIQSCTITIFIISLYYTITHNNYYWRTFSHRIAVIQRNKAKKIDTRKAFIYSYPILPCFGHILRFGSQNRYLVHVMWIIRRKTRLSCIKFNFNKRDSSRFSYQIFSTHNSSSTTKCNYGTNCVEFGTIHANYKLLALDPNVDGTLFSFFILPFSTIL